MEISIRDKLLDNLQIELEHRKNMLKKKSIDIQSLSSENRFLENVKDDYQKHYQYMKKIKEEQYRSMGIIADYLDSLLEQSKIADFDLKTAKIVKPNGVEIDLLNDESTTEIFSGMKII